METINLYGVNLIAVIQEQFPDSDEFFDTVTQAFDPLYAYSILFPFLAGLNSALATDILVVSASTEWLNMILKWILREDRPFWWVRETTGPTVTLRQTPLTCETGPGSPSGHVMGAAALGHVLVTHLLIAANARWKLSDGGRRALAVASWSTLATLLLLVATSRLYVATHFPHQCLLGAALGVGVSWSLTSLRSPLTQRWRRASRPKLLAVALAIALTTLAAYWLQRAFGLDPQRSVKLAFKWCAHAEHVHVATTPLFCVVRDAGLFFGLAAAAPLGKIRARLPAVPAVLTSAFLAWALDLAASAVPTNDARAFYAAHFVLASVQPPVYLLGLPIFARKTSPKRD